MSRIAIVDYGMGNLCSIRNACRQVGLEAVVTGETTTIERSDGVILPGVGAFADAMSELKRQDLVGVLSDAADAGKPLLGICLGMQLLMSESSEFGQTQGLNLIPGRVQHFNAGSERLWRVPFISWNRIEPAEPGANGSWEGSILQGIEAGEFMYFAHSYYVIPSQDDSGLAYSQYASRRYCSVVASNHIAGCQFHPERSGPAGLKIYRNWATLVAKRKQNDL